MGSWEKARKPDAAKIPGVAADDREKSASSVEALGFYLLNRIEDA